MKVNFEELKNMDYESGKEMLIKLGYVESGTGTTEAVISDYTLNEYFTLFDDDGNELDTVGYSWFYDENPGKADDEDDNLVKEEWSCL